MSKNKRIIVKKSRTTHDPLTGTIISETTTCSSSSESSSSIDSNKEYIDSSISTEHSSSNSLTEAIPSNALIKIAIVASIVSIIFACLPFINPLYITACWLSYVFGGVSVILSITSILRKCRYAFVSLIIGICTILFPIILAPEYASIALNVAKSSSFGLVETINELIDSIK